MQVICMVPRANLTNKPTLTHLKSEGVFTAQRVAEALDRGHGRQMHRREQLLVGRRMVRSLRAQAWLA